MVAISNQALLAFVAALALALTLPAGATAKSKPITGKLSKRGYTVIALAPDGEAQSVLAKRGKFKLRPPAKIVTLHLRAQDGTYAGPLAFDPKPKKGVVEEQKNGVIVSVKAGTSLGKIAVKANKGYAKFNLPEGSFNRNRMLPARKGKPIGAGVFGRVATKKAGGPASDQDLDGIPTSLDVDDDGDLILDTFDSVGAGTTAHTSQGPGEHIVGARAYLNLELADTANVNGGSTDAQVEAALSRFGNILAGSIGLHADPGTLPELDCADPNTGLAYCRRNGSTATVSPNDPGGVPAGAPFPACCDTDGDGFGSLAFFGATFGATHDQPAYGRGLRHGATSAQIRTGDLLIERTVIGGRETEFPGTLQYVFNTVPALASYNDGAGNAATLSYPVAPGALGTTGNGFPVADGPDADSDVQVTLTFWRPQRRAMPGETGNWTDIGNVDYAVAPPGPLPGPCPQSAYSETDPNLAFSTHPTFGFGLRDSSADQPASPAHTFSFSLNLTQCVAAGGSSFLVGNQAPFGFGGIPANAVGGGPPDRASTTVWFKRQ